MDRRAGRDSRHHQKDFGERGQGEVTSSNFSAYRLPKYKLLGSVLKRPFHLQKDTVKRLGRFILQGYVFSQRDPRDDGSFD